MDKIGGIEPGLLEYVCMYVCMYVCRDAQVFHNPKGFIYRDIKYEGKRRKEEKNKK